MLIGQSAESEIHEAIEAHVRGREEVESIFNLITFQLGDRVMVAVKAKMAPVDTPEQLIEASNRCEAALRKAFPQIQWCFFEPDLRD